MIRYLGRFGIFSWRVFSAFPYILRRGRLFFRQVYGLGVLSISLVLVTSIFIGMVTALQTAYQMEQALPIYYLGSTSARTIMIELAPVVISLVVAGRAGSFMASEIGTMKVSEQLDALEVMGIDPIRYICLPRVLASLIVLPVLVIFAEVISIASAGFASQVFLGVQLSSFLFGVRRFFYFRDLFGGLLKTLFFGLIIGLCGTYFGVETGLGAEGVGRSTTRAVVTATGLILAFDFLIAFFVFR
jgi:phospholipid/cholesterol/gamma-HCH transport system permease protein